MTHSPKLLPGEPLPQAERDGVYRAILTRRDTRGEFLPDPVPDEVISRILTAAHHAPSVGFMQPWDFIVVRNAGVRRKVHGIFAEANAEAAMMFEGGKRAVYSSLKLEGILESPVSICITCDRERAGPVVIGRTHIAAMDVYSCVCAVQNLWLAARAEGLGVGWVSIFDNAKLQTVLGIPENVVPIAYLCLGKVAGYHAQPELEEAGWRERQPIRSLMHFDGWGEQDGDKDLLDRLERDQAAVRAGKFV